MQINLHKRARTTPAIREEIRQSTLSVTELAQLYNVTKATVRKWKNRDTVEDRSHRPHNLHATLSPDAETIVAELRKSLLLPLDDLLVVVREFIQPNMSRSALDRCLRRHGLSNLSELMPEEEQESSPKKSFKSYEPGFVHVDVKYLPQMPGETSRKYLFAAIDRATRWVYLEIKANKSADSSKGFLKNLVKKAPFRISIILTDNGKEFTDRFCATGQRQPTGNHAFDKMCAMHSIDHRLIKPRCPQTNGMVERFNGRVEDILNQTRFTSADHLKETMLKYNQLYNHHIPQKSLGHLTPIQAMKKWQDSKPELFNKSVYHLSGPDT